MKKVFNKNGEISKTASVGALANTPEELKKVNKFSLEPLTAEEVYLFKIAVCSNAQDTDRDNEPQFGASSLYVRHLGIYAYRGAFLKKYIAEPPCPLEKTEKLEQLRALWMGAKIAVVRTEDEGVGVDTPEDAERVAAILANRAV